VTLIACVDVSYDEASARAACILFHDWADLSPAREVVRTFSPVAPYEPGQFYRRELPPLLGILRELPETPGTVIVDGYVWLDAAGKPGLGAHLHAALDGRTIVIGVAKSRFEGAPAVPLVRGSSRSPLFVSAAGLSAEEAAQHIAQMSGSFRLPTLLKRVDQLSRTGNP
jgi:deoxyribonuclease V